MSDKSKGHLIWEEMVRIETLLDQELLRTIEPRLRIPVCSLELLVTASDSKIGYFGYEIESKE
jgi:hypothetical protein